MLQEVIDQVMYECYCKLFSHPPREVSLHPSVAAAVVRNLQLYIGGDHTVLTSGQKGMMYQCIFQKVLSPLLFIYIYRKRPTCEVITLWFRTSKQLKHFKTTDLGQSVLKCGTFDTFGLKSFEKQTVIRPKIVF